MTSCAVGRTATAESVKATTNYTNFTDRKDSVFVAEKDTVREVTTITVDRNEAGDTVKVVQVTDRERVRNSDRVAAAKTKVEVRTDTVFVEHRDSVFVETLRQAQDDNGGRKPAWVQGLKWVFWIIVAVIALTITLTITKTIRSFF